MCIRGNTNASFPSEEGVASDGFEWDEPSQDNVSKLVDYGRVWLETTELL